MAKLFQFHKGSIKTRVNEIRITDHDHFNSIKVRLRQHMCFVEDKNHLFQFHKGSIKTMEVLQTLVSTQPISIP